MEKLPIITRYFRQETRKNSHSGEIRTEIRLDMMNLS